MKETLIKAIAKDGHMYTVIKRITGIKILTTDGSSEIDGPIEYILDATKEHLNLNKEGDKLSTIDGALTLTLVE